MAKLQKRLASDILKVGLSRVWLDPTKLKDIDGAITRIDIKKLIKKGHIKTLPEKIHRPRGKSKKKKYAGSRKGSKHAIVTAKRKWISTVRPLRRTLKELFTTGQIEKQTYKKTYMLIKGGMFRSKAHLKIYLGQHGLLKKK